MGLFDWLGTGDATPAPAATIDPRAMRQQAFFQGLTELGAGLLAAGQRRPITQPSLMPQALTGFKRGYNQGLQNQYHQTALEQQADQSNRWQGIVNGQTQLPGIDERTRGLLGVLGPQLGPQALASIATRPQGRPLSDAEIAARRLTPGLPWQVDQNNIASLPAHDPRVLEMGAAATARGDVGVRGVDLGFTGQRGYPDVSGRITPSGPVASSGPLPGGARPIPAPGRAQRAAMESNGIDPDAYPGGPNDPYRDPNVADGTPTQTAQADPTAPRMREVPGYGRVFGSDQTAVARARATGETQDHYVRGTLIPQINSGMQALQNTRRMRDMLSDPALNTGPGAGIRNSAAELLRAWGGQPGAELAGRIQSPGFSGLESLSATQVLAALGGSLGTGISNADVALINSTVPNPFQSRETLERFIGMIEDRALSNVRTAHGAYSQTMLNYNPATDPVTSHLSHRLVEMGLDPSETLRPRGAGAPRQQGRPDQSTPAPVEPPQRPTVRNGVERGVETDIPRERATLPTPGQIGMMTADQLGALAGRVSEMTADQQVALQRRLDQLERAAPRNSGRTGR